MDCNERTPEDAALVESMIGRTIVQSQWLDDCRDDKWTGHTYVLLTLDDGRVMRFASWGYDAWGTTVSVEAPTATEAEPDT